MRSGVGLRIAKSSRDAFLRLLPEFELVSPNHIPVTATITPRATPRLHNDMQISSFIQDKQVNIHLSINITTQVRARTQVFIRHSLFHPQVWNFNRITVKIDCGLCEHQRGISLGSNHFSFFSCSFFLSFFLSFFQFVAPENDTFSSMETWKLFRAYKNCPLEYESVLKKFSAQRREHYPPMHVWAAICACVVLLFIDISTFLGYLMPNQSF